MSNPKILQPNRREFLGGLIILLVVAGIVVTRGEGPREIYANPLQDDASQVESDDPLLHDSDVARSRPDTSEEE